MYESHLLIKKCALVIARKVTFVDEKHPLYSGIQGSFRGFSEGFEAISGFPVIARIHPLSYSSSERLWNIMERPCNISKLSESTLKPFEASRAAQEAP